MIHARIQEFPSGGGGGGGGVQVHLAYKKSSDNVFLNLFHRSPVVTFKENYYLPRFQWVWNIFQGEGGPTFYRGVQLLFPYRNPYNVIFQGAGPDPLPLDPPMWFRASWFNLSTRFSLFFFNLSFAHSFVERGEIIASAAVLPAVVVVKY